MYGHKNKVNTNYGADAYSASSTDNQRIPRSHSRPATGPVRSRSVGTTETIPWARHHSSVSEASGSPFSKRPVSQ